MINKKEYLHIKPIKIPFYQGFFVIIITNSIQKIKKYLPKFGDNEIYGHTWDSRYLGKSGIFMILNFDNTSNKMTHGAIAHESVHVAHFIANRVGIQPCFDNDEPIAYLLGWIANEAYGFINKLGFKVE